MCRSAISSSDPEANQEFGLELAAASEDELQRDQEWISSMIATWLDEEWTPLEVHTELGKAAGAAYVTCRQQGDDDMSSLVLGLSNELLAFNYRETFVNAFEVANKVVEMLMMRSGIAVCCTSDEDVARLERFSSSDSTDGK